MSTPPRPEGSSEGGEPADIVPKAGLIAGPALFFLLLLLPTPPGLAPEAQRAGAVAALMAVWWLSEAVPIAATALAPLALYPLLGVLTTETTAQAYGNPNIFLFMGGFMIAMAMRKWELHRRLGLYVLLLVGSGRRQLILGFMAATGFISMWVSNTASAVMMLPVALAVVGQMGVDADKAGSNRFAVALLLSIAYGASIGGVATLIGTPPNLIFAGQAAQLFPDLTPVTFTRWLTFGVPLSFGFLLLAWLYLAFVLNRGKDSSALDKQAIREQARALGPWTFGEKAVLVVFLATALGWIWRSDIALGGVVVPGWTTLLGLRGIHDATVAMAAAVVLFMVPARWKPLEFLLDWPSALRLPWGVLLLFGAGFALAESLQATGLAGWLVSGLGGFQGTPPLLMVLLVCLSVTFLSEVTSNTVTAALLLPIMASAAVTLGVHPYMLMVPATIAASFSFMMPVGTPPNAVVYGSGYVTIGQMARSGLVLNLIGAVWVTAMVFLFGRPVFGM